MASVLIVDDDPAIADILSRIVKKLGHSSTSASDVRMGMDHLASGEFDVVLLDVFLPDGNGLEMIPGIKESHHAPEIIIITAFGDPDSAELAIKNGAWDYILKPSPTESIMLTIKRALAYRKEKQAAATPRLLRRDDIIGSSPQLTRALERVALGASTKANVLITGETGTGKELFARAIHRNSERSKRRFVVVDCASLPDSLVESTLFGHEKGAYTGADKEREGLIKQANGGTLFLDEIGELPLGSQKALLRVIQEHRFRPVSGKKEIEVDFRLISATNRNLEKMATAGEFRQDLLYRIRTFGIQTPPLRKRKQDIKKLSVFYINKLCDIYAEETKGFSSEFFESLQQHDWPGNVRELFNTLEEAMSVAGREPILYSYHLPTIIRVAAAKKTITASAASPAPDENLGSLNGLEAFNSKNFLKINTFRDTMERKYLQRLTLLTNGNRKEACRISGLSRTRLFELLKKHELSKYLRKKTEAAVG
ncbi:MAG: sigma-54-dependent Fis family transcriptional regulator [Desulfobacteraceae bacterium]|nr:sigma-54-dependent Fis family transcriptional regulator [Desulfobacteraceae bacterium]